MDQTLDGIQKIYRDVVSLFPKNAQDTLLLENKGKHLYEIREIIRRCNESARILDFGGGVGFNLIVLSKLNSKYQLFLIDRFEEYTEKNKMGNAESAFSLLRNSGILVVNQDFWVIPKLPYDDQFFDVVTCFAVIEHLPGHPMKQLKEMYRVLKGGGTLILSGPNAISTNKRIKLLFGKHPYIPFDLWCQDKYFSHYREYTPSEYSRLVKMTGFSEIEVTLLAEPTKTRAEHNYWNGSQHSWRSAKSIFIYFALKVNYLIESMFPTFRSSVYCFAKRPFK